MTEGKSQPPPRNSNTISSSSRLAPPPPYSEDIERGVNETSPLYPTNPVIYTVPRELTDAYQSASASSSCKTLRTILLFSILAICKEKEITIHGIEFKNPAHCTIDVDRSGTTRVYGHWIVGSNEPRCMTTWEDFRDKGCAAKESKSRRIEAQMGNHQPLWDDWRAMCSTTPADYEGHHFDRPDSCDRLFG
ncbi:uncharacterized protein ARMOST_16798 [Armillaria ostoyae]|uniref:Uncharacterized protein n=1 Tax=Armillaria ostoyae TaxID=47428 RepID=A0A284RX66_ARMOS|nr:uncharacterized protein ARMOST_16798 [Armillaria ostoyae]